MKDKKDTEGQVKKRKTNILPAQGNMLQYSQIVAFPVQSLPPFAGGGFVQVRTLVRVPLPQVWLQSDQGVARLQLPSTAKKMWKKC